MADSQKRKKLVKSDEGPKEPAQRYICYRCGTSYSRQKGFFPASHSDMYRGMGYLPICCDCVDDIYEDYCIELNNGKEAMRRVCMKLDLYWDEDIYAMMERSTSGNSRVRNYIGKTNIIRYMGKAFDDTLKREAAEAAASPIAAVMPAVDSKEPIVVSQDIIDFWGEDFAPEFLIKLDKRYQKWTGGAKDLDNGSVSLYKQICLLEETINRDAAAGKPTDKNVNMLNTLLGSVNEKPVQKKSEADAAIDNTPFGVWIDRWENKRPIPDPDPAFKDVDGIIKYITTWFYGHISHTLGIKNMSCKLYEDEIAKMRIKRPELAEEDDESLFNKIFGKTGE